MPVERNKAPGKSDLEIVTVSDYWSVLAKSWDRPYIGLIARIPPRLWREIRKFQDKLRSVDDRQVFADLSTLHIPVKGLGLLGERFTAEKEEQIFEKISKIVSDFPAFQVQLKGVGVSPMSVHIRVTDTSQTLRSINKRICKALEGDIDTSPYDGDSYVPCVTIVSFTSEDASKIMEFVDSIESREMYFGEASIFELEAVEAKMHFAFGGEDTQPDTFSYVRSFSLR